MKHYIVEEYHIYQDCVKEIMWLYGSCRGWMYLWEYFAGEARKIPPHLLSTTVKTNDPIMCAVQNQI